LALAEPIIFRHAAGSQIFCLDQLRNVITIICPGVGQVDAELQLVAVDVNDGVAFGLSRLDAAMRASSPRRKLEVA